MGGYNGGELVLSGTATAAVVSPPATARYAPYSFVIRASTGGVLGAAANLVATPEGAPVAAPSLYFDIDHTLGKAVVTVGNTGIYPITLIRIEVYRNSTQFERFVYVTVSNSYGESPAPTVTITGLAQGFLYSFSPRIANQYGFAYSRIYEFTTQLRPPPPPQNLSAAVIVGGGNAGNIALQWQPPVSVNGATVLAYRISWNKTGGGGGGETTVSPTATAAVVDVGADRFEPYIFVVRASNATGLGEGLTATATPVLLPQGKAVVEVAGYNREYARVTLRLSYGVTATPIDRYRLHVRYGEAPHQHGIPRVDVTTMIIPVTAAANGVVSPISVVVSNLVEGTIYAFMVIGGNAAGDHHGPFNQVTLHSSFRPPLPPTSLQASVYTDPARGANSGKISLVWGAPSTDNNADEVLSYLVSWSKTSDGGNAGSVVVSASVLALLPNIGNTGGPHSSGHAPYYTPYNYAVRASNAAGLSAPASIVATPEGSPIVQPEISYQLDQYHGERGGQRLQRRHIPAHIYSLGHRAAQSLPPCALY